MQHARPRPLVLVILDGWGYREEITSNAIAQAKKPNWDKLWHETTHSLISGSGECVGLPSGQMGNSEVGHLNMGAGRIVHQDLTRIDLAIEEGDFFRNETLMDALLYAKKQGSAVHVFGLLSPGGVHSHEKHIHAIVRLSSELAIPTLYLHAFLDGRDTPPKSALTSLTALNQACERYKKGKIVSLIGRYYAMDRDKRWDRIQKAYDLLTLGKAAFQAESVEAGLTLAYERGESDEFVQATSIHDARESPVQMRENDVAIFMNFRADRARELTESFISDDFPGFSRTYRPALGKFICLAEYDARFLVPAAFPPISLTHIFADCVSKAHLTQLRIAETEKYAHVTFFFNGGVETPFPGEERILIPSPHVATYDLQPEMSALPLTERLIEAVQSKAFDVIICNYANADMVGHTGNFKATVKAIETIDASLGLIIKAVQEEGGEVLITADHGNAEQSYDFETNQPHTAHTRNPVPFIYVGRPAQIVKEDGKLSDIAPTMLYLLDLPQPPEMTGKPLLRLS